MKYLSEINDDQTLTMVSGHPQAIFPSHKNAPRVVITNGMVIPNYSSKDDYDRMNALGVTMYGQMTAGSYCCMFFSFLFASIHFLFIHFFFPFLPFLPSLLSLPPFPAFNRYWTSGNSPWNNDYYFKCIQKVFEHL